MKASSDQVLKAQRLLTIWSGTRKITGILVIGATVLMIVSAILAFRNEESTSQAMKVPLFLAIVFAVLFVRSVKKIQELEAMLRR
jgi:hypothetical protein